MKRMRYVVGIDGGGTKTTAELCDEHGTVLASASGGPSNFQVIGPERAAEALLGVLKECCVRAQVPLRAVRLVVAGLSGAGREDDQKRMLRALRQHARRRGVRLPRTIIESDALIALEGAFAGKPGIVVIVGTGSIVFGKDERGTMFRAGGWGRILGDDGSGYAIGQEGLRAVAGVLDGASQSTLLVSLLARRFGLTSQEAIIRKVYRENFDVAWLAPCVIEAAERGDRRAGDIIRNEGKKLISLVGMLVTRMRKSGAVSSRTLPVAVVGSMGNSGDMFSRFLRRQLSLLPSVVLQEPESPPVHGACLIGLSLIQKRTSSR